MASWTQKIDPTHFSVFAVERKSKRPIVRLPVYAEVAWVKPVPPAPLDNRFAELAMHPMAEADPDRRSVSKAFLRASRMGDSIQGTHVAQSRAHHWPQCCRL
jgi:hypothetical protein